MMQVHLINVRVRRLRRFSRAAMPAGLIGGLLLCTVAGGVHAQATLEELDWAYAISPEFPPEIDDGTLHALPGTDRTFTLDQIRDRFGPADWYPGDHLPMPPIVAFGREDAGIWACALCHYPNGMGKPENAGVAGLTPEYFIQQLHDFRDGLRRSANGQKANTNLMIAYAQNMTDEEIENAAQYFSAMSWQPWIEVVETDTVPKTFRRGGLHIPLEGPEAGVEPIGRRIIESPVEPEETEVLRNPRAGFIARVPVGSIAAGENLARTGGGKTIQCAICHGEDLAGLGAVPPLRGRSPSYIARQLFDLQRGTRRGPWAPLMQAVVENLNGDDMIQLSAYLGSLPVGTDAAD